MELVTAKSAGFCPGVNAAVETLQKEIASGTSPLYTWGPIIHNAHVVESFRQQGVKVLNDPEALRCAAEDGGTILIRSHGTTRAMIEQMQHLGFSIVDATCPFVKRIHRIVEEQSLAGRHVIIVGSARHPEVAGICGWCPGDYTVIETAAMAENLDLPTDTPLSIVCQTTFRTEKFKEFIEIIENKGYDVFVSGTVCNATSTRQKEAFELASGMDLMLVVGDRHSSNTQKLYEICKAECENTYLVETSSDIHPSWLEGHVSIGITAGASTPNNIIKEVQNSVRSYF